MKNYILLLVLIGGLSHTTQAQQPPTLNSEFNNWLFIHPQVSFNNKYKIGAELHLRRAHWVLASNSLLLRPYFDYKINKHISTGAGYTYIASWPTKPLPGFGETNEHNIWEQLQLSQQLFPWLKIKQRYRLEHRFRDHWDTTPQDTAKHGVDFSNRFRHRLTLSCALYQFKNGQKIKATFFDEIWIDQYKNLLFKSFARNWAYIGIGANLNPTTSIELGYMNQLDLRTNYHLQTHIVQLALALKLIKTAPSTES